MPRALLTTLAAAFLITAAPTTKKPPDDRKKLQGTWTGIAGEVEGDKTSAEEAGHLSFTITGNTYTVKSDGQIVETGTFTLDPTRKPRSMDATLRGGDEAGKIYPAIYELMGDTLQICIAQPGKPRPRSFSAPGGSGLRLFILRRPVPVEKSRP